MPFDVCQMACYNMGTTEEVALNYSYFERNL